MAIIHAGLNDCLNLEPHQDITKTVEEVAAKFPDVAMTVCTQPEAPAIGMTVLGNLAGLNKQIDMLCSRHPGNMELVDLRWTKERIPYLFIIHHYTKAAGKAVYEQLTKCTRAFF
ncbi:hypothetical protein IscW_ISCW021320 [Ixodes scapularis]|uniref:Uncharacterized protein n=1 Tax=Ixodes scapularis TaxID=6945 RepID=B7Q7P6_IXOSC|nr:hypothetical protein IscW_ISCW021320 [Ixodes scapularis]|eukprot:XP_002404273.1 hypothetical protein IscW_ISCW021320 [Ixodes scapularis]